MSQNQAPLLWCVGTGPCLETSNWDLCVRNRKIQISRQLLCFIDYFTGTLESTNIKKKTDNGIRFNKDYMWTSKGGSVAQKQGWWLRTFLLSETTKLETENNPRQTLMVLREASKDVAFSVVWSLQTSMVQREQACGKGREKNLWERPEAGSLHVQNMEGRKWRPPESKRRVPREGN